MRCCNGLLDGLDLFEQSISKPPPSPLGLVREKLARIPHDLNTAVNVGESCASPLHRSTWTSECQIPGVTAAFDDFNHPSDFKSTESVVYMARTEQTTVLHSRPTQRFQSCCCFPRAMCAESESMAFTNLALGRHHLASVIDCAPVRKNEEVDAMKCTSRNSLCVGRTTPDWLCQLPSLLTGEASASVASNCCLHL